METRDVPKAGEKRTYLDYFQGLSASQKGMLNCFGVRLREGSCLVVVKNRDGQVNPSGKEFRTPLQLERLPTYIRMIIDDHVLNYPASDLIAVLTGEKPLQEALDSPMLEGSE
jgi:hypothetical protein